MLQLFDNEVVDFLVELHDVVALVVVVDVAEAYLRVLLGDFYLNGVFLREELELLQGPLEVLDFPEDQGGDILVVELPLIAQVVLGLVSFELQGGDLLDFLSVEALGLFWDPHFQEVISHRVLYLQAIIRGFIHEAIYQLLQLVEWEAKFYQGGHHILLQGEVFPLVRLFPDGQLVHLLEEVFLQKAFRHNCTGLGM